MSVNMLSERLTSDCQPRWKNGHPHQSTTGVLRMNCIQRDTVALHPMRRGRKQMAHRERRNTGRLSACADPESPRHVAQLGVLLFAPADRRFSAPAPSRKSGNCPDDPARSADASGRCRSFLPQPERDCGSSAIPHFGHAPGRSLFTSGCMGQTNPVIRFIPSPWKGSQSWLNEALCRLSQFLISGLFQSAERLQTLSRTPAIWRNTRRSGAVAASGWPNITTWSALRARPPLW